MHIYTNLHSHHVHTHMPARTHLSLTARNARTVQELTSVGSHMLLQVGQLGESPLTNLTFVRFYSSMDPCML